MLIGAPARSGGSSRDFAPGRPPRSPARGASLAAFLAAAVAVLAFALPGGAYDIVLRQEYGIAVWAILGAGFASGLLPRSRPARPAWALLAALALYAAWTAASLLWSVSRERTTAELARDLTYLGLVLLAVCLLDRRTWRAAALGAGAAAVVVCGLAVASRLLPGAFPTPPFSGTRLVNRLSYPFEYWNAVGAWGCMSAAFALAWSVHDPVRARRAVALGAVPLCVLAAYLAYSRAAVAGAVVGAGAVVVFSRHRWTALLHALAGGATGALAIFAVRGAPAIANGTGSQGRGGVLAMLGLAMVLAALAGVASAVGRVDRARMRPIDARIAVAAIGVIVLVAAVAVGPGLARSAWRQFRHPAVVTGSDPAARLTGLGGSRYYYWKAAVDTAEAHPLGGTGAGTYGFAWNAEALTGDSVRNAHSLELENLAELGVPGGVLILVLLATAAALLVRLRRRVRRTVNAGASVALLALFLVYCVEASVDWMWQCTAVTALALGGVAIGSAHAARGRLELPRLTRVSLVLLAVCAALVELPGVASTIAVRRSQAAERSGRPALAYALASAAVGAEPWAASPYEQRALVLEAAGRFAQAEVDLRRAVTREPTNYVHWLLLGRVEFERGRYTAGAKDLATAHRLRPKTTALALAG